MTWTLVNWCNNNRLQLSMKKQLLLRTPVTFNIFMTFLKSHSRIVSRSRISVYRQTNGFYIIHAIYLSFCFVIFAIYTNVNIKKELFHKLDWEFNVFPHRFTMIAMIWYWFLCRYIDLFLFRFGFVFDYCV